MPEQSFPHLESKKNITLSIKRSYGFLMGVRPTPALHDQLLMALKFSQVHGPLN